MSPDEIKFMNFRATRTAYTIRRNSFNRFRKIHSEITEQDIDMWNLCYKG